MGHFGPSLIAQPEHPDPRLSVSRKHDSLQLNSLDLDGDRFIFHLLYALVRTKKLLALRLASFLSLFCAFSFISTTRSTFG